MIFLSGKLNETDLIFDEAAKLCKASEDAYNCVEWLIL